MKDWKAAVRTWEKRVAEKQDAKNYDGIIESNLRKIATKELVKETMKKIPENLWWKVDAYLKRRYPGGGNNFSIAERELIGEKHQLR